MKMVCLGLLLIAILVHPVAAQEAIEEIKPASRTLLQLGGANDSTAIQSDAPKVESPSGNRWMLICCGLPGDETHREKLTTAVESIVNSAETVFNVPSDRLRVLIGDEDMPNTIKDSKKELEICTAETVAASLSSLAKQVQPNDSLWVIFLGHAQLYSGRSTFNVKGKDFDAPEFSKWLVPVQCRERVLMLTMPVSGFWLKPLRGPKSVLISATDADFEFTGTEMPYALARVVSGKSEQALEDIDQDGSISLRDLYIATCIEVQLTFKGMQRLQTEHAQLEDNGDGVGREIQEPYLPVEAPEGDVPAKPVAIKRIITTNSDGDFARTLTLVSPVSVAPASDTQQ